MNNNYLLSNKPSVTKNNLNLICRVGDFSLYGDESVNFYQGTVRIYTRGYVLPKRHVSDEYSHLSQYELIEKLWQKFGQQFIHHVKGIFTLFLIHEDRIEIFNDHLGIDKFFYTIENDFLTISNAVNTMFVNSVFPGLDPVMLGVKALLNREINGETIFRGIYWSKPATRITLDDKAVMIDTYWHQDSLLNNQDKMFDYEHFTHLFRQNVNDHLRLLKPENYSITLTGGKDSRTALSALKSCNINPLGITYGHPQSKDAIFAAKMAVKANIRHEVINPEKNKHWFQQMMEEIIALDNPLINIHRGHRYYALKTVRDLLGPHTAYYSGYMGGELLMGIYHDNLIFTDFLTSCWENANYAVKVPGLLQSHFIRPEVVQPNAVMETMSKLTTLNDQLSIKMKQFHSLFEIGILHHSQDLQIALKLLNYPIPFFLDLDFLESLFSSGFSMLHRNSHSKNVFEQHKLFRFNLNVQHLLYPELDNVPFAKKGSYNTREFLQGPVWWSLIRAIRLFGDRHPYPPTFSYNASYQYFITEKLQEIIHDKSSPIHEVYDVALALATLTTMSGLSQEHQWHRFSNIVMHYLQINNLSK